MSKTKDGLVFFLCILLWFGLFCSGIVVGTKGFRAELAQELGWNNVLWILYCWLMIFFNYAITNTGMLCCLAAVIGGMTHIQDREAVPKLLSRGLFVFLIYLGATYAVDSPPLADISQERYMRMVAMTSFMAYVIGYNPDLFESMMSKSKDKIQANLSTLTNQVEALNAAQQELAKLNPAPPAPATDAATTVAVVPPPAPLPVEDAPR